MRWKNLHYKIEPLSSKEFRKGFDAFYVLLEINIIIKIPVETSRLLFTKPLL